jgi:hypothetical protein
MGLLGGKKNWTGHLDAKDIVNNPAIVESISGKYILVKDKARYDQLTMAINIMAEAGWKCISFVIFNPGEGAILMERIG